MAVRTFTMPKSLNESLASSQPTFSDADRSSMNGPEQNDSLSQQENERKPGITFAAQDKLPKLPIPDLESTCQKYLDVLKPLQSNQEQSDTAAVVQDFLKGEGPELQTRLKKYATGKTSYIEQFCMSVSSFKAFFEDLARFAVALVLAYPALIGWSL